MCKLLAGDYCLATGQSCLSVTTRMCMVAKTAYRHGIQDGLKDAARFVAGTQWEEIQEGGVGKNA